MSLGTHGFTVWTPPECSHVARRILGSELYGIYGIRAWARDIVNICISFWVAWKGASECSSINSTRLHLVYIRLQAGT